MRQIKFKILYKTEINRYERCKHEDPIVEWQTQYSDGDNFPSMHWSSGTLTLIGFDAIVENCEEIEPDNRKCILVEFTGLKDKNGKEIYEGDIVKWCINDRNVTAPVGFEGGSFWMLESIPPETCGKVYNDWGRGEYEIIGNIYENPELLKQEADS